MDLPHGPCPLPLQGRGKKVKKAKMGENLAMYYNEEVGEA